MAILRRHLIDSNQQNDLEKTKKEDNVKSLEKLDIEREALAILMLYYCSGLTVRIFLILFNFFNFLTKYFIKKFFKNLLKGIL